MEVLLAVGIGALVGLAGFGISQGIEMLLEIREMNKKQKEMKIRRIIQEELKNNVK